MLVEIEKIVQGGYGLARHGGSTVLVPYSAPGDRLECRQVRTRKHTVFARIERIVEPSPMRREAECPVFTSCGGCHFQHLSYGDEIEAKSRAVLEELSRIGKIRTSFDGILQSPARYGYRNHAIFKVDENRRAGFLERESENVVPFPPGGCLLLPDKMRSAIEELRAQSLEPLSEVRVRMDRSGEIHFWGLEDRVGPPEILMETGKLLFPLSPDSFYQVNLFLGEILQSLVCNLPRKIRRRLLDLYCGVGFFTLALSSVVVEALGIERSRAAVRNAMAACRLNHITNVRFRCQDASREISRLRDFDLLVVDPPRRGLAPQVLRGIVKLRPAEIVYIACDAPAFSRDAALLIESGYLLSALYLVDLFPATCHTETISLFRRG